MARRDVIVIGASAGGLDPVRAVIGALPPGFPATVLVVMHVGNGSVLPQILDRAGDLPVRHATPGDRLEPGTVLVAPPEHHLLVVDDSVTLSRGPQENSHRPSVDVLFRSAARALGARVVGVVMSGALDDGTAGLIAITQQGGTALVQDPAEALQPSMPLSALRLVETAEALTTDEIAKRLVELVSEDLPAVPAPDPSPLMEREVTMADLQIDALNAPDHPGIPSGLSCPDCHGILFEIEEGDLVRYRCRVGHAWSPESLAASQAQGLETALWIALRSLEEKAALSRDLAARSRTGGHRLSVENFERNAEESLAAAAIVRGVIDRINTGFVPGGDHVGH
jgi:two-component system, chemotaxis family, protein-glutamate methylesterase/glutaminase